MRIGATFLAFLPKVLCCLDVACDETIIGLEAIWAWGYMTKSLLPVKSWEAAEVNWVSFPEMS